MPDSSPICCALERYVTEKLSRQLPTDLSNWATDQSANTCVFSYKRDFSILWGIGSAESFDSIVHNLARREGELALIVVWDDVPLDTPQSAISVAEYVTPYEWAAILSLELYKCVSRESGTTAHPKIRIMLLNAGVSTVPRGFVQQTFSVFHGVFPWIQDYCVVTQGKELLGEALENDAELFKMVRQVIPLGRRGIECLLKDLLDPARVYAPFEEGATDNHLLYLSSFAESWRQQFLKAGNRHNIANLVGPLVLASALPGGLGKKATTLLKQGSLVRQALYSLLESLELVAPVSSIVPADPQNLSLGDEGPFNRRKGIQFLLVDDQALHGYQHILGYTLFSSGYSYSAASEENGVWRYAGENAGLTCVTKADRILDLIHRSPISDWLAPRKLEIPDCDVLLLDLRLWLDEETTVRQEFMKRAVALCEALRVETVGDRHLIEALAVARRLAQGEFVNELPALGLLPLLLSHYDPSLPIVIFSSSHQRDVLLLFSGRPNIITDFAKPLLSGYDERLGSASRTAISTLKKALLRAIDLHEERVVWLALANVDQSIGAVSVNWTASRGSPDSTVCYSVNASTIRCLAVQYRHTLWHGHFANALTEPRNWLEAQGIESRPVDFTKDEAQFLGRCLNDSNDKNRLLRIESRRNIIMQILKPWKSEILADDPNCQLDRMLNKLQNHKGNFPDYDIAHLARWIEVISIQDCVGQITWRSVLEKDASIVIFQVLNSLRNARAHYAIHPDHNTDVRVLGIFAWLWLVRGILSSSPLLIPGGNMSIEDYVRPFISSSFNANEKGSASCKQMVDKLKLVLANHWFKVTDGVIELALERIWLSLAQKRPRN